MKSKLNPELEVFTNTVDRLLSVPHSEIQKREKEYREKVAQNPRKRGPKQKVKPSASRDLGGA
jgi:hypothetical protein